MPDRPASTIAIWLAAAALAVFAGVRLLGGGDDAAPPVAIDGARAEASARPAAGRATPAGADAARLYVHVAGAVRRPGLIRVPGGTRVATALDRAGGPTRRADLTLVNLAARVQDGQQIVVPISGAGGASSAEGPPGTKVHISTATVEQLDEVDGIGPTLAERIIEYRDAHGGFRSVEELGEVDGIGEVRLEALREAVQP
jgi:competence protein ComEA